MKKREIKLGIPSYITVESEEGSFIGEQNSSKFEKEDICVEANENGEIWLTADNSPVKTVKLRWNTPLERTSKILGGVWERTYGDAEWKGMSGTRFMPWYFLALNEGVVTGYGVKVRPSAMCFWEADTRGITLVLDVRCGGTGVVLSGRKLLAAEVIAMHFVNACARIRFFRIFRSMEATTGIMHMETAQRKKFYRIPIIL